MTQYCVFFLKKYNLFSGFYLHRALYQEYLNIQNLNILFVLIELFPIPDLLHWRIPISDVRGAFNMFPDFLVQAM